MEKKVKQMNESPEVSQEPGIISLSTRDIARHWFETAQEGIKVSFEEIHILPQDNLGRVKYYPHLEDFASYNPVFNEIRVGNRAIGLSEAVISSFLRHEKSHSIFANLGESDQREIVSLSLLHHSGNLGKFYEALRRRYPLNYFDPESREKYAESYRTTVGRGKRFVEKQMFWNQDTLEQVDLVTIVDELIAFYFTTKGMDQFLVESRGLEQTFDMATDIFQHLNPDLRKILELHGFFGISSKELLSELKNDPDYRSARKPHEKVSKEPAALSLDVDREQIKISAELSDIWKDILRAEANDPLRVEIKVPLSDRNSTEFDYLVLYNLRYDIQTGRERGETAKEVFRELAARYHPDLYLNEELKVQRLANEYFSALTALRDTGELNF